MPDILHVLKERASQNGIRLDILERDYALSYLIAGLSASPLADRLVLKGGTTLRKFYYPDYRFSEDLDCSTRQPGSLPGLEADFRLALRAMQSLLDEHGPFQVQYEPMILRKPHPFDQAAFLLHVRFPYHRQPVCRLKVEITTDEPLLLPPIERPLFHDYDEALNVQASIYTLGEIVAEKLRALLQSAQRLRQRGWGASRVCRDYYDLWEILRREPSLPPLRSLVEQKCQLRGISFESLDQFFAASLKEVAYREWKNQILPFVPAAPSPEQVLSDLESLLR
ncbi:MAG: nucleotidyl transferase AbiEii/AbiGii toxin family protein [Anaerolineales bacterium]